MILAFVLLTSVSAWAYDFMVGGIAYNFNNDTEVRVASEGDYDKSEIIIPSKVTYGGKEYTVVSVGSNAFHNCLSIKRIIISEGVTSIDNSAFSGCKNLESIMLPESITYIGSDAFAWCYALKAISIPSGVESLDANVFRNCTSLVSMKISCNTILSDLFFTHMQSSVFRELTFTGNEVADYNSYSSLTYISNYTIFVDAGMYDKYASTTGWKDFSRNIISADMLQLRTVDITADENNTSLFVALGDNSLYTANLKIKGSINGFDIMTLRNKIIHLLYLDLSEADIVANDGGYEYYTGRSLKADNELGEGCFESLSLREVILPKSLTSIAYGAFRNCKLLEKVILQDGLTNIGDEAFRDCESLNNVQLPSSLTKIGYGAFASTMFGSVLQIPDNIEVISDDSFSGTKIDSLFIGKNVREIGYEAFNGCYTLKAIKFNRKLNRIGTRAFAYCSVLNALELPYTVEIIEGGAFAYCRGLQSLKIPSMTKSIGDRAFEGCTNITAVYTYTVEPTTINQQTFSCYTQATLNVPKTSSNLYFINTQWSQFIRIHEFDEPYDAFYLNGDVQLDDKTGRMSGEPDADMYANSGFIIEGDSVQELSTIELSHDGTDGGSIIGALGDVTGNQVNLTAQIMKVNISVDGNRWYFFCFPFDVEQDSVECTTDYVFYAYDGDKRASQGSGWTKLDADFGILSKGEGYIFQASRTGILTIHVGNSYLDFRANDEKEQLSTYTSQDASNAHWNFIGNPYISYYDVQDLAKEYDAPIVIWNGNGYDAYKPGDDDYQLHPFQAFFVQKETGTSYVEFLPENRITYNQAAEISSQRAARRAQMGTPIDLDRQLVNISIMSQDSLTDRTRIVYSVNASMDYEIGVDAAKFQADGVPQLYTLNGKTKYAINERHMGSDEIKLGYTAPKAGTYTLSVTRHDAEVEIYDNVAKSKVDFTFGDYSFQSQAGTFNDRFVVYKTSGGVTKVDNGFRLDGMTVKTIDGGIVIEGNLNGKVQVYSESGMLLAEPRQAGRVDLGDGVYIIKVGDKSIKLGVM